MSTTERTIADDVAEVRSELAGIARLADAEFYGIPERDAAAELRARLSTLYYGALARVLAEVSSK